MELKTGHMQKGVTITAIYYLEARSGDRSQRARGREQITEDRRPVIENKNIQPSITNQPLKPLQYPILKNCPHFFRTS